MAKFVNFTIDDTSPTISYSPFPDTFSTPNLSAGWNPYYTLSGFARQLGDVGNGTSLHITSHNGSSLLIQWHGTGIQLSGNATSASYAITLDGAPYIAQSDPSGNVLATIEGLSDAPHAVALTAIIPAVQNPPNSSMLVFEKALIMSSPAPANVSFRPQTINDNDIAFLGRWSFNTTPNGASFHTSQTTGDRALINFSGTTFLLQGITSPHSGNYTVTIDNVTTSLSGRSSFTSYNSLLFFASGLSATSLHTVLVTNNGGGDLSLLVDGIDTFVPYSTSEQPPLQNSPTSVVIANEPFSPGTIAAFVLAGILGFLIITGLLFFFFVYRPWRRRRRRRRDFDKTTEIPKEHEAGVLDIGPEVRKTPEPSSRLDLDSIRNGFSRWKKGAVEGNVGDTSLAIRFRHSDSLDEKHPSPLSEHPHDDLSENPSTNSSTRRKARAKSKGKARQITGRSWSPGFTFEFPLRQSRSHRRSDAQDASSPVAESLGYVSTFMAAEPSPKNLAPPSYAASVSLRDSNSHINRNSNSNPSSHPSSNMPSVPRSVSPFPGENDRSYTPQNQESSGGFLLRNKESSSEQGSSGGNSPHRLKPPEAIQMKSLTKEDKGKSAQDQLADNQGTLEPVSLQQVIKGLSPRTIRHPYAIQDQESIHAPPSPQETNLPADNVLLTQVPQTESNDDELVEVRDGVFLSVRMPSPFKLSFDKRQSKQPTSGDTSDSPTALSYMTPPSSGSSEPPNLPDGTRPLPPVPTGPDFVQGTSNAPFRLTPLYIPPTTVVTAPSNSSNDTSGGVTSFLDFSSSREGSLASRSRASSWSEERRRRSLYPQATEGRSRWSNTTVPSMVSKSSNHGSGGASRHSSSEGSQIAPSEHRSSTLPIPTRLSIPPSPYHAIASNRRSRTSGLTQTVEHLHVHPGLEGLESPTDSIAMSVSELHFRQSVSEENTAFNSRRTTESSLVFVSSSSHPPLPTRLDDFTPRPFDPSILVSRVLGLSSPTSTITARPTAFSNSGSVTTSSTPSPFALRHNTDIWRDRSYNENSETDSLGL